MSLFTRLRHTLSLWIKAEPPLPEGEPSSFTRRPAANKQHTSRSAERKDALLAVNDLSRLLSEDPGLAETGDIAIALGNLFRAQGNLDHAVALREKLLARSGQDSALKARISFELACDYRRAGLLDRALFYYKEAEKLGFSIADIHGELAHLYADSGDFKAAAHMCEVLGNIPAQAHFLVRLAEDSAAQGDGNAPLGLIQKALAVYPGSPEAWLALCSMSLLAGDAAKAAERLAGAFSHTRDSTRLLVLEGLLSLTRPSSGVELAAPAKNTLVQAVTRQPEPFEPDFLYFYYGGIFLQQTADLEEAETWYTKAVVLQPGFWAARLALMDLALRKETLSPILARQIAFFTREGMRSKRFICPSCNMRRDQIFYSCPRCHAWHSVNFRLNLQ